MDLVVGLDFNPMSKNISKSESRTEYRRLMRVLLRALGGEASFKAIFVWFEHDLPHLNLDGINIVDGWEAEVRQVLEEDPDIELVQTEVWRFNEAP